jgi:hypothetical protein
MRVQLALFMQDATVRFEEWPDLSKEDAFELYESARQLLNRSAKRKGLREHARPER